MANNNMLYEIQKMTILALYYRIPLGLYFPKMVFLLDHLCLCSIFENFREM
jgi:hypothetical protein